MDEKWLVGILVSALLSAVAFLVAHAVRQNTNELKGLREELKVHREDLRRIFEREEKSGREIVGVQGDIRRIDERCARIHGATPGN